MLNWFRGASVMLWVGMLARSISDGRAGWAALWAGFIGFTTAATLYEAIHRKSEPRRVP
jgi:hypothetical protein